LQPPALPADQPAAVQTVVITAPRLPPSPGDAAFSVITLNERRLRTQPRLDTVLEQVPGVSLFRRTSSAAANPTTQGVSLRSIGPSGASRALVTLDGVPQNDPFGGWVIWTSLPPEGIENAQIVRGAGSGPYGAGALTGVIALQEMSRPGAVNIDAEGADLGGLRGAAATARPIGFGQLFLSASGEQSDGWVPVRYGAGPADDRLTLRDWSAAARIQASLGPALAAARISAYQEDRDAGLVGAQSTAKGVIGSLTVAAQPGPGQPGWRLQGWVHHSDLANSSVSVAPGRAFTTPANDEFSTPATGWGVNGALRGQGGGLVWELGADVRGADGTDHEHFRNLGSGFTRLRVTGGATMVAGGYAEASYTSGPWLLTGGVRLDGWFSRDGHRTESDLASGAITFQSNPPDRSGVVPSGRIALKRDLGGGTYVRAAGYSGFRAPTLNELYRPFRVGNDVTESNPSLKPERLYGGEVGLGGASGGFTWDGTLFINHLQDAVANVTIGKGPGVFPGFPGAGFIPAGGTLFQRQNAGLIKAEGVELDATYSLTEHVFLRAAADYTHAEVDGGSVAPQLTGKRPAQAPRFTATAGFDWSVWGPASLHGQLRYESLRYDDDQNTRRIDPSVGVDARLDWKLAKGLSAFVGANNLFDADIQTGRTADGTVSYDAPRVWRLGLTFRE
jgi:outer membrane receptor protein involved in Fe transport